MTMTTPTTTTNTTNTTNTNPNVSTSTSTSTFSWGVWAAALLWALLAGLGLLRVLAEQSQLATAPSAARPLASFLANADLAAKPKLPQASVGTGAERGMHYPPEPTPPATAPIPTPTQPPLALGQQPIATPTDRQVPEQVCAPWLKRWPSIAPKTCHQALLVPSGAQSVQAMPIAWRDVAPSQLPAARRVLIVGAIHGDELTSAVLALNWVAKAQEDVQQRSIHWRFIPVLNPDGFLARPATRMNASGVDLNRNFPTPGWEKDAPKYWKERTRSDPRRWPGPAPLSEPESRFLHEQIREFAPDLVVSIHAPYGILDFDGPQSPPERLGHLWLDQLGVFPGSLGHYSGLHLKVPVVTIELKHALDDPSAQEAARMWSDLIAWLDKHLPENPDPEAGRPY